MTPEQIEAVRQIARACQEEHTAFPEAIATILALCDELEATDAALVRAAEECSHDCAVVDDGICIAWEKCPHHDYLMSGEDSGLCWACTYDRLRSEVREERNRERTDDRREAFRS